MIHETEEGFIDKTCFGVKKTSLSDQTESSSTIDIHIYIYA